MNACTQSIKSYDKYESRRKTKKYKKEIAMVNTDLLNHCAQTRGLNLERSRSKQSNYNNNQVSKKKMTKKP